MAAPVSAFRFSLIFRDAKGQVSRTRAIAGGATAAAVITDIGALATDMQDVTNAHVTTSLDSTINRTYGTNAEFPNVEDKMVLTFVDPAGNLHRYQIPAPKLAMFQADGETVNASVGVMVTLISAFTSFIYGRSSDVSPLVYVGGIRLRRRFQRRFNIFTLDPTLGGEGE